MNETNVYDSHAVKMKLLLIGLRLEVKTNGKMRLTNKAPTCYSQVKNLFGLKGNREKVLNQFEMKFYKLGGRII
jgi:hypothetical protein